MEHYLTLLEKEYRMGEFNLQLAGSSIHVKTLFDLAFMPFGDYLSANKPVFSVTVTCEDIALERVKTAQEDALEGKAPRSFSDAQLESTALQRKIAEQFFSYDTLVFHGSVVAVDGAGYLFTAKSGTGKSTHTRLWREVFGDRAVMVNDDKPFLKIQDGNVTVYGSPWMGKHGLGSNTHVPLKAICILERGEKNEIANISPAQALPMLIQQSQRPQLAGNFPKYMALLDQLSSGVSFYRLRCNMNPEAAQIAYQGMSEE